MAEHDYDIANADGATVRADINSVLDAIVSNNSKATEPTDKFAHMWWYDTANNILKQRNEANTAWIERFNDDTGAIGGVVQMVDYSYTTDDTTNSTSYVATGLTLNITPLFSDSKILVIVSASGSAHNSTGASDTLRSSMYRIYNTVGANMVAESNFGRTLYLASTGNKHSYFNAALSGVDEPGNTNLQTYRLEMKSPDTDIRTTLFGATNTAKIMIMEVK